MTYFQGRIKVTPQVLFQRPDSLQCEVTLSVEGRVCPEYSNHGGCPDRHAGPVSLKEPSLCVVGVLFVWLGDCFHVVQVLPQEN